MPRFTGTVLTDSEGNNRTATHLATNILMVVNGEPIGALQQIDVNEDRPSIAMIDEIGTDGHIDSAPNQSTNYTLSCQRIRFDRKRIAPAFDRGFVHVKSQRIPFDVEIHDFFHDSDRANSIITVVKNCWIKKISYSVQVRDWIITESMDLEAEDMYSIFNGREENIVAASSVTAQSINPFEREADRGGQRGALDAPGLIDAYLNG